jgi:hypothetical protein
VNGRAAAGRGAPLCAARPAAARAFGGLTLLAFVSLTACEGPAAVPTTLVDERGVRPLDDALRAGIPPAPVAATFQRTLRLLGARLPARVKAGEAIEGTLWWLVAQKPGGRRPQVLVRARAGDVELAGAAGDHAPRVPVAGWRAGDVVVDRFRLVVPEAVTGPVAIVVGLAEGDWRWQVVVDGDGGSGATDEAQAAGLVAVGSVEVEAGQPLPEVRVPRLPDGAALVIDGVLDEPAWATAPVLPLVHHLGRGAVTRPTTAQLLWSPDALYLAFRAVDPDPHSPYTHDDDPLYESEALELFLDADGDGDVYVELQAAPTGRRFDAAFAGGRRQGMDVGWNAGHVVATRRGVVELTAPAVFLLSGVPVPDGAGQATSRLLPAGFVQEWRIPVSTLRDVPPGEPRVGARWRANLFRLERLRDGARVTATEASAWSPPLGGDFHALSRFGTLEFVDAVDAAARPAGR